MKEIRQGQLPSRDGRSRSREGEGGRGERDFLIVSAGERELAWLSRRRLQLDGCQISLQKGNKGKRMFEGRKDETQDGREGKCRKDENSPDDDPFFNG